MIYTIGVGDYKVSNKIDSVLKTYALGSCVGVIVYDYQKKIGGFLHVVLPESNINLEKAKKNPAYFVDTGLKIMFQELKSLGFNSKTGWVKIIGGSNILDNNNVFNIGKRNVLAIKKYLWQENQGILKEDVGGSISRTVSFNIADGSIEIFHGGTKWYL